MLNVKPDFGIKIIIPYIEFNSLVELVVAHYNVHRKSYKKNYKNKKATEFDKQTLFKMMVNYIRHNLTNYDAYSSTHQKDISDRFILERKIYILREIRKVYSYLFDECTRQIAKTRLQLSQIK